MAEDFDSWDPISPFVQFKGVVSTDRCIRLLSIDTDDNQMGQHGCRLSERERSELWKTWKNGQSLSAIGRALAMNPGSVHRVLIARGGIPPAARQRSGSALTLADREEISRGLVAGCSYRQIARELGRSASTISREVARNRGSQAYRASAADQQAWAKAHRPKPCRLALNRKLRTLVARKLQQQWSPEQIAAWLKLAFPEDPTLHVSHETIYRSLYLQARGVLKKQLQSELRTQRKMRHSRNASAKGQARGQIVDAVPISQRPPEIEDRAVPGHWEGDLICGSKNSYIATLVERHSRFTLLVKVNSKHTQTVVKALSRKVRTLPAQLRQSLTWDRGLELAQHKQFTVETKIPVYFCDPRSPWQRGSNENTNGLLRQYFPDGTDLSEHSQRHLDKIARRLNQRPRKTLGFKTPAQVLSVSVASTG